MGGTAEHRRAKGFQVARSSYQGQFVITVTVVSAANWFHVLWAYVQSCRGTSISEVRYTPEGLEVRVPHRYLSRFDTEVLLSRMTGSGAL
jgi:hypothetical protein